MMLMNHLRKPKNNPLSGFMHSLIGFLLIWRPSVLKWVILPLLLNSLMFIMLISYVGSFLPELHALFQSWLPGMLSWLSWLLWPAFLLSAILLVFFGFALCANIIAAPFNAPLSAAVVKVLTGESVGSEASGFWAGFAGAVFDEIRKLVYSLSRLILISLLFLIPVVNVIAPLIMLYYSAWLLAQQYMDFPMGNVGMGFKQQRQTVKQKRPLMLGFGSGVLLAMLIPGINLLAVPASVAGATRLWVYDFQPNN